MVLHLEVGSLLTGSYEFLGSGENREVFHSTEWLIGVHAHNDSDVRVLRGDAVEHVEHFLCLFNAVCLRAQMACQQQVVAEEAVDAVVVEVEALAVLLFEFLVKLLLGKVEKGPPVHHHRVFVLDNLVVRR